MKDKLKRKRIFNFAAVFCLMISLGAVGGFAQTTELAKTEPVKAEPVKAETGQTEKSAVLTPAMSDYKGIKIGMTADEVREIIDDKPEVSDKDGFYYRFSDTESAQILLDADKKVRVIVAIYAGKNDGAPEYADVFGKEVPVNELPDGRIYNLVRYENAGYWVAYNRTAGENPLVTVTIQKF